MAVDSVVLFEVKAEMFRRETGSLAPGKDSPAARGGYDEDAVRKQWDEWHERNGAMIRKVLEVHQALFGDEE